MKWKRKGRWNFAIMKGSIGKRMSKGRREIERAAIIIIGCK